MITTILKIPYLRFKYKFFPNKAQKFWAQELLNSQGLSAKIGQIIGQGKVTTLPKGTLSSKKAKDIFEKNFSTQIELTEEVLAASMGQVYFGEVKSQHYAIKILHPNIREKILKEINHILELGNYFAKTRKFTFDKDTFRRFLNEVFEEETNLEREAQVQEIFYRHFERNPRFIVPKVIKAYTNNNILCQEKINCILARDLERIPHNFIFQFFFKSLFDYGLLHGDLNDRNWGINDNNQVVVYDYGCSQIVSPRRIEGLKKLISNEDIENGFKELGVRLEATSFKNKQQELRNSLFNPLFEKEISPDFSYSANLQDKYGDRIKELRQFTDPWILLMMRSLFSLIKFYQSRGQAISLKEFACFDRLNDTEVRLESTQIKIEVLENKKQVVFMTLPITALDNLEFLIPENVLAKIREENISLPEIIEKIKQSNLSPQDLFRLSIGIRDYKVWIE